LDKQQRTTKQKNKEYSEENGDFLDSFSHVRFPFGYQPLAKSI